MESADLARLVGDLRSFGSDTHSVEVKSAAGRLPKTVPETLSAFSNGAGGTLILGLDEAAGFRPASGFDAVSSRDALARACGQLVEEGRLSATAPPSSRNRTYRLSSSASARS
jgi:ATP-dependent DNA helicase RecG